MTIDEMRKTIENEHHAFNEGIKSAFLSFPISVDQSWTAEQKAAFKGGCVAAKMLEDSGEPVRGDQYMIWVNLGRPDNAYDWWNAEMGDPD